LNQTAILSAVIVATMFMQVACTIFSVAEQQMWGYVDVLFPHHVFSANPLCIIVSCEEANIRVPATEANAK
jgi:hypothetical protein